tara:strand:- start:8205 stop:8867 length:663 start_codon:yes stop_codon:yes gene_type:complete
MKPANFNNDKVTYSDIKQMGTTGKQIYLNYDGNNKIAFHTPKMRMPFGISKFDGEKYPKYSIDMSFDNMDTDPKIKAFYDALMNLEEKIIKDAQTNSLTWFKKRNLSEDVVKSIYSPTIRRSKDKETGEFNDKYSPTIKIKLPFYEGEFKTVVFDHNRQKLEGDFTSNFTKGSSITSIVKCSSMWISGGKFGLTWSFEQIKMDKPKILTGYAFIDSDNED